MIKMGKIPLKPGQEYFFPKNPDWDRFKIESVSGDRVFLKDWNSKERDYSTITEEYTKHELLNAASEYCLNETSVVNLILERYE